MFVRVLNILLALAATAVVATNYGVAEQTRVAGVRLAVVEKTIGDQDAAMHDLKAEFAQLTAPENIQALAESELGMTDQTSVQLASLTALPRRGEAEAKVRQIAAPQDSARLVKISVGN